MSNENFIRRFSQHSNNTCSYHTLLWWLISTYCYDWIGIKSYWDGYIVRHKPGKKATWSQRQAVKPIHVRPTGSCARTWWCWEKLPDFTAHNRQLYGRVRSHNRGLLSEISGGRWRIHGLECPGYSRTRGILKYAGPGSIYELTCHFLSCMASNIWC